MAVATIAAADFSICNINRTSGECARQTRTASTLQASGTTGASFNFVTELAFSADGKFMVSAGGSEFTPARNAGKTSGQIKLWDADTGREVQRLLVAPEPLSEHGEVEDRDSHRLQW